jgi:hypothetical protein
VSDLEQRLAEDKALRDAALALFKADIALVRADLAERGLGKRISDRLGESTMDVLDEAVDYAEDNKGKVAAGIAAVILWFARGPILDALARLVSIEEEDEEPADAAGRSDEDRTHFRELTP